MIANHPIGSATIGSTTTHEIPGAITDVPDLIVTRLGTGITVDEDNIADDTLLGDRKLKIFRSADIRGVFSDLVEVASQYIDTVDGDKNYKYKGQFVYDYSIGDQDYRQKGAKSKARYAGSDLRQL